MWQPLQQSLHFTNFDSNNEFRPSHFDENSKPAEQFWKNDVHSSPKIAKLVNFLGREVLNVSSGIETSSWRELEIILTGIEFNSYRFGGTPLRLLFRTRVEGRSWGEEKNWKLGSGQHLRAGQLVQFNRMLDVVYWIWTVGSWNIQHQTQQHTSAVFFSHLVSIVIVDLGQFYHYEN